MNGLIPREPMGAPSGAEKRMAAVIPLCLSLASVALVGGVALFALPLNWSLGDYSDLAGGIVTVVGVYSLLRHEYGRF
ncbi:MAG: hypothetical protein ACREFX_12710 [Opitutaceae bacterium]